MASLMKHEKFFERNSGYPGFLTSRSGTGTRHFIPGID
jgi:hypothetical protein